MLRFNAKLAIVLVLSFVIALGNANAQPAFRAKERLAEFKKMKLLEILDLDEKTSQQFLSKYTAAEKAIEDKHSKLEDAMLDLEYLLRKKASKDEISKQSQKVMDAQRDLLNTMFEQQKEIKSVLNDEQFAKYLIFENRFRERLQKAIIEKAKGKGWKGNGGQPNPRRQKGPIDEEDIEIMK